MVNGWDSYRLDFSHHLHRVLTQTHWSENFDGFEETPFIYTSLSFKQTDLAAVANPLHYHSTFSVLFVHLNCSWNAYPTKFVSLFEQGRHDVDTAYIKVKTGQRTELKARYRAGWCLWCACGPHDNARVGHWMCNDKSCPHMMWPDGRMIGYLSPLLSQLIGILCRFMHETRVIGVPIFTWKRKNKTKK